MLLFDVAFAISFAVKEHLFLKPKTMSKATLLLVGAILCRGGRTVCAALRGSGMQGEEHFDKYHGAVDILIGSMEKASMKKLFLQSRLLP